MRVTPVSISLRFRVAAVRYRLVVLFCCPVNYSFRTPHRGRPVGGPVLMKLCARNVSVSLHLLLTKYTAMKKYSMSKPCWAGMKVLPSRYTRVSSSLKRCLQCELGAILFISEKIHWIFQWFPLFSKLKSILIEWFLNRFDSICLDFNRFASAIMQTDLNHGSWWENRLQNQHRF